MATAIGGGSDVEVGFAKLQGEDFEYYMQSYSIMLGRNSKKSTVDVDLSSLGGGMNISRNHARIFYDFTRRRFSLEVLGKNGCLVEGVLHLPGNPNVKLDSQDLLQIGDKEFYFLLPVRSILGGPLGPRHHVSAAPTSAGAVVPYHNYHSGPGSGSGSGKKSGRGTVLYEYDDDDDDDDDEDIRGNGKKTRRDGHEGYVSAAASGEKKREGRTKVDREADDQQVLQLEEKDVVSSVATVLSDLCGPGDWMPMEKLHLVILKKYGNVWHHSRVRRYLTLEDWAIPEAKGKPWYGLLMLLRKYPEHFVINTRSKGRVTLEWKRCTEHNAEIVVWWVRPIKEKKAQKEYDPKGDQTYKMIDSEEFRVLLISVAAIKKKSEIEATRDLSEKMIYDVNSTIFRSFLSQKGNSSDKRKMEDKPREQKPKASDNKPVMNE